MISQTEAELAEESFWFQNLHSHGGRIARFLAEILLTQPATVAAIEESYKAGFRDGVIWTENKNNTQNQITG
jgi:hypothetical protein